MQKARSLIIANLISPRIDYKSYGKSIINLAPFADDIAEITVKACSGGGSGTTRFSGRGNEETNSIIGFLDVRQYDDLIQRQLRTIIENDYTIKVLLEKIDNLVKGEGDEVSFS